MEIDVRKYQRGDRERLLQMDEKPPSKRRAQKIRAVECLDEFYAYVAEQKEKAEQKKKVMGFIIMKKLDDISHYMVQINVKERRKGIGRRLVQEVFGAIGTGGHISLCVNTDNVVAIAFYESLGFKKSGYTEGYRKNQNKYWYQIDL